MYILFYSTFLTKEIQNYFILIKKNYSLNKNMQVSLQQFSHHLVKLHRLTSKTMWRSLTFHQSWSELSNTLTLHPALPKTRLHSDSDSVNTRRRKLTNLTASHWYRAVYRFVIGKDSEKSFDVASVLLLKKKHVFMTRCGFWLWNSVLIHTKVREST